MKVWTLHNATPLRADPERRPRNPVSSTPDASTAAGPCRHRRDPPRDNPSSTPRGRPLRGPAKAEGFAAEIAALAVREHGGGNRRLAIDKIEPLGLDAVPGRGPEGCFKGQELVRAGRARSRAPTRSRWCAGRSASAEAAMARMYQASEPGAHRARDLGDPAPPERPLRRRLDRDERSSSSGPRTNPWFQECSDRVIRHGEMISLRHRHDRPLWLLRRPLALVDLRPQCE